MINLLIMLIMLILLFIISFYLLGRDILSPPIIMNGMFLISTFVALINYKSWNIDYSPFSVIYIVTGIVAFTVPFLLIESKMTNSSVEERLTDKLTIANWKLLFVLLFDAIILYLFYKELLNIALRTGYSGYSIQWNFRTATSYEGAIRLSNKLIILTRFMDASAYIFGFVFMYNITIVKDKFFNNIKYLIPVFFFIVKTLMTGGRQDILRIISALIIQSYILNRQYFGWKKNISRKYMKYIFLSVVTVLPMFYYAIRFTGRTRNRTFYESISTYLGGSIQHFNQYVQDPIASSGYFGEESLTPILNLMSRIGIIDFYKTVHLEFRQLGVTIGNVYTFFRRPLHDFGILGMYVFVIMVSILFVYLYVIKIKHNENGMADNVTIIVYSYLAYWIVLSSIEQYSMTILSLHTLTTIISMKVLYWFYLNAFNTKNSASEKV